MRDLAAGGVNAFYFEIDSELGHLASGPETPNGRLFCANSWSR
jgi:hypothetical protein